MRDLPLDASFEAFLARQRARLLEKWDRAEARILQARELDPIVCEIRGQVSGYAGPVQRIYES